MSVIFFLILCYRSKLWLLLFLVNKLLQKFQVLTVPILTAYSSFFMKLKLLYLHNKSPSS